MPEATEPHFELSWNGDGIAITEYDISGEGEPTVEEEWWFTWVEVFKELTDVEGYAPDIV